MEKNTQRKRKEQMRVPVEPENLPPLLLHTDKPAGLALLYDMANDTERWYREYKIPKRHGGFRFLSVPAEPLKTVQRNLLHSILSRFSPSPFATAYMPGGSICDNARPHQGQPMMVKMDVRDFFRGISFRQVLRCVFEEPLFSPAAGVLLAHLCTRDGSLPQGAPTSPMLSNLVMKGFDEELGGWCQSKGIIYTRYCDDFTFSGCFSPEMVLHKVKEQLARQNLFLREEKTQVLGKAVRHQVTGVVVNRELRAPRETRRRLRQEMYYIERFGLRSHLERCQWEGTPRQYAEQLAGRVSFVLSIDPADASMRRIHRKLSSWLVEK